MDDNKEEKSKNIEEWNRERGKVKPLVDVAVDCHNRARTEVSQKNYDMASRFYKESIKNYREAINKELKYYLQDLLGRVAHVISEYMCNIFIVKIVENKFKDESDIHEFVGFIDGLKKEEKKCIYAYDVARISFCIANFYYEKGDFDKACEFYNRVIEARCDRSFINRDAHFKIGKIQFNQMRFKEAVVNFVSVLSFDRDNREVVKYIEDCLGKLNISKHKKKFLTASPNEAKKLIMEVL
ncbi:MAG: tetratricopeptide repeat protein [Candidatus Omnitrophica bacterium]|nr:tetratricopeptide repeat protein [Candidatus Omnitrophota bacterium]